MHFFKSSYCSAESQPAGPASFSSGSSVWSSEMRLCCFSSAVLLHHPRLHHHLSVSLSILDNLVPELSWALSARFSQRSQFSLQAARRVKCIDKEHHIHLPLLKANSKKRKHKDYFDILSCQMFSSKNLNYILKCICILLWINVAIVSHPFHSTK